jgi:Fe-Mn family superoxide dismutase
MSFSLPSLPFSPSALAQRGMCQETLELHHGKHHANYVNTLNTLLEKQPALQSKSLEEIIKVSFENPPLQAVYNNAGQHWNHCAFWQSLSPEGGRIPAALEKRLVADFGSVDKFKQEFKAAALGQFGSGWAWLIAAPDGKLKITKTSNADNPIVRDEGKVLLVIDVWEHAYYVDYRNRRADFVDNFLAKLANFDEAAAKLQRA